MANAPGDVATNTTSVKNKINQISLLPLQEITTAPRVTFSTTGFDVTNVTTISIFIHMGRITTNPFTAGVNFRVEANPFGMNIPGHYYPLTIFTSAIGSSVASKPVTSSAAAGQNTIPMTDTTGFSAGNIIYIDNPTVSKSEFARITTVNTNTSVVIEENLRYDQTTSTLFNQAEIYSFQTDVTSNTYISVAIDGSGTGQNFAVEVEAQVGA